jgi:hypothetical protein
MEDFSAQAEHRFVAIACEPGCETESLLSRHTACIGLPLNAQIRADVFFYLQNGLPY